jgi:GNAT superfamily N-acetyltransferase
VIVVTEARPEDVEALARLADEMDKFYGAAESEPLPIRKAQINAALFVDPPLAYALLAWQDSQLQGFAAYSYLWPAIGLSSSLYLKELYVAEGARRQGVGKLLMERLCTRAVERHCTRVEWTTDRDSEEAQRFYASLGYEIAESKLFYRVEESGLLNELGST